MAAVKEEDMHFGESANPYEDTKLTLFDVNMEKARAFNKKHLIHRLIFVAKINRNVSEKREVGAYYERLFKQLHSQIQGETFTGLLLIYPSHIVHIVETSTNMLQEVIKSLHSCESTGTGQVHQAKILVYANDVSFYAMTCNGQKHYKKQVVKAISRRWGCATCTLQPLCNPNNCRMIHCTHYGKKKSMMESHDTSQSSETAVSEAIALLLKLGQYLTKIPKVNLKVVMDQLHEKVPNLLLQQDTIEYFCEASDLCSPKDYLEHYGKPFDVVLDNELVWPIPSYLLPISWP